MSVSVNMKVAHYSASSRPCYSMKWWSMLTINEVIYLHWNTLTVHTKLPHFCGVLK